jgi:hypothetical protein
LQAIFVVDAVNMSLRGLQYGQPQLQKFLRQDGGRPPMPTPLVLFADTSSQVRPVPSRDGNALASSLDSSQLGSGAMSRSQGFYGAAERVQISLRMLENLARYEATQPGRKLLIWLSSGWPSFSGPEVEATAREQVTLFRSVVALSTELREARITLYSIDPLGMTDAGGFPTSYYASFLKGVSSPLRDQPPEFRRAILLISETIDRGSHIKLDQAVRAIGDTNTIIYSLGFPSPKSAVRHYASEELPTVWNGGGFSNPNPQHPGGCMAKDSNADPGTSQNKLSQAYDCLGQLAPPLAVVRMAVIAAMEGMRRNAPETVAHLTGGEFYPVDSPRSIERDLMTLANHLPNRYLLSFHPQSPAPGPHSIALRLKTYSRLVVTARTSYWVTGQASAPNPAANTHP